MREFKTILPYFKKYKWNIFLGLIALLVVDGAQITIPLVIRRVINILTLEVVDKTEIIKGGLLIIILGALIGAFRFLWRYNMIGTSRKIEYDLRNRLYEHIQNQRVKFFDSVKIGDLMALATNDIDAVRFTVGIGIVAALDSIFFIVTSITIMFLINTELTLYILAPLPILSVSIFFLGRKMYLTFKSVQALFAKLTNKAQENYSGINIIKSYVQEDFEKSNFSKINQKYLRRNMKMVVLSGTVQQLIAIVSSIGFTLILLIGGRKVILTNMTMGDFVAFSSYLGLLIWPMIATGWVINLYQRGKASMKRLNDMFSRHEEIKNPPEAIRIKEAKGNIEIRNLNFSYKSDSKNYELKNINMKIKSAEFVGILGRTGSGKSTLVRLLPRLYEVPDNTIFLDGIDIKKIDLYDLRSQIAFVPQESFLFSDTIMANIKFGRLDASDDEAIEVAKLAMIHDEIMEFPQGYNTIVGEKGVTLSGGQKQRIALARALLMKAPILILDDSFSAVDAETEQKILENLQSRVHKQTIIMVTHRISAMRLTDKIYVIDNGEIIEEGTHFELIKQGGLYSQIYEKQKLWSELEQLPI